MRSLVSRRDFSPGWTIRLPRRAPAELTIEASDIAAVKPPGPIIIVATLKCPWPAVRDEVKIITSPILGGLPSVFVVADLGPPARFVEKM